MRALLLAAGIGSRLRPLTETVPKCLVPIHGRPLLDYWLELLFSGGTERVLINTHWLADHVRDYVASCRWRPRIDLVHEGTLLGTGGTILANRATLGAMLCLWRTPTISRSSTSAPLSGRIGIDLRRAL
jgi:mannose-1-phosphate guanylyltransferase